MKIVVTSVMVDNQEKALAFYTEKLGFIKKNDIPMGEHRWLTVVSPEGGDVELLLEPMAFAPAKVFQKALFDAGMPCTIFGVAVHSRNTSGLKNWVLFLRRNQPIWGP